MIKLFLKQVDMTSSNTIQRDLRTLEDEANAFTKLGSVTVQSTKAEPFVNGTDNFILVSLEYIQRPS